MISLGRPRRAGRGASNRWQSDIDARRQRRSQLRTALPRAARRLADASQRVAEDLDSGNFSLFGFETSRLRLRLSTSLLLWVALALVASNLTLVALRSDVTRVRYELSQASAELRRLDEESRALTLKLGELKSPRRLAEIARSRGFGPPERIVELP